MRSSASEPIFVTGCGLVSPLGHDCSAFWRRLTAGETGIGEISKLVTSGLRNSRAGEVKNLVWPTEVADEVCDEVTAFAVAAAQSAAQNAGWDQMQKRSCGLVFSTNFGGAASWEACCDLAREGELEPETFAAFLPDHGARFLARIWGNNGPQITLSNACSSGTHALGIAFDWLRSGRVSCVLAGGFDGLGISTLAGLSILRTISPDEIRPFDAARNGTIFGEGAAFLALETQSSLEKRGAKARARVLGYGVSNNAHHLTAPDAGGAGLAMAMKKALENANVTPEEIGYINAHGTGTTMNDLAETQAIQAVFGQHARHVAVSSTKAATSHLMGGAGAIEAIACVFTLENGVLPPTLNLENAGEGCDLDYIPQTAREKKVEIVVSNSSGIGGNNASIVLSSPEISVGNPTPTTQGFEPKISISGLGTVFPDPEFSLKNYAVSPKTYLDRASALALAGASLALENAGLSGPLGDDFALITATQFGCIETMRGFEKSLHEKGTRGASPILFSHSYFNSPAALLSIEWGIQGYHAPLVGQNSALEALELARLVLENGDAKHVLVGAFEAKSLARTWSGQEIESQREGAVFVVLSAGEDEKNSDFVEVKSLFAWLGHV